MGSSRNKIIISILVLVSVFVITLFAFFSINRRNTETCANTLKETALTTDSRMGTLINSYYSSLENFERVLIENDSLYEESVENYVLSMRVGATKSTVRLYLPDGSAYTENGRVSDISDYMDYDDLIQNHEGDGKFITQVMNDYFNSEKPVLEQCYIIRKNGSPIGILSTVIDLLTLPDYITTNAFSGKAGLIIVDRVDGTIFLDTETRRIEPFTTYVSRGNQQEDDEFIQAVMSGQELFHSIVSKRTGKARDVFIVPASFENWEFVVTVDDDVVFERVTPIRNILMNLTGFEFVLFLVYLFWINRLNLKEMNFQNKLAKDTIMALEKQIELQHELSKEKELLQDFHEMIHSGMWKQEFTLDGRTRSTVFSDDFRRMLGYEDKNEFPNDIESLKMAMHPDDRDEVIRKTREKFLSDEGEDSGSYDMVYRLQCKNAEYRWYHVMGKITRYEEGTIREVTGIFVDVTAEKENELNRITLKRNLDIIDVLASEYVSVYFIDVETSELTPYSMNSELEQSGDVFRKGTSFRDAIRYYAEENVYEPDREAILDLGRRENLVERLRDKKSFSMIYRKKTDGQLQMYEVKFVKVDAENEAPTGIAMGFANRNTELLNSYVMKKLLDDYITVNIIDLDQESYKVVKQPNSIERITSQDMNWNERVRRIGAEISEDTREVIFDFDTMEGIRRALKATDKREYIFKYKPEDRSVYSWRRTELQVVERRNGVPIGVIVTVSNLDDITSQKETLHQLVAEQNNLLEDQKKQLEVQQKALKEALAMAQSANRAKTTFLNNMSHDIRTPMNAIIGYTGLAMQHITSVDLLTDYLRKISHSSDHLLSLINDVLDMSRIESGKVNINEKEENLSEILHSLRDIVQPDISAKQLDFFMDSMDVNDEIILCDKLRLKQVLLNVLSNAVKYTYSGGSVSVRTIEKSVSETGYGCYQFRIKDTGIGMSEEFLKTIYDPFTRMNSSAVSGIQGTGLGMAITKNIVNMMGGNIEIISEEGKGTEVILDFEFKLLSEPKLPEKIEELENIRGLVVDDDSNTCRSVAKMLRECGIRSEWCLSGKEAVIRAEDAVQDKDGFEVYFIDWILPDQNGLETVRKLRKNIGNEVPVIIMTAYDWADVEEEAKAAGVTQFVTKPLFPSDIKRVLLKCFNIATEEPEVKEFDFRGKRILLVEDNPLNMEIATDILENNQIGVVTAEDGTVAVDIMKKALPGDYDAILMDIQMPVMNGYEATRQIRAIGTEYTKNIPIIAMTANAFDEDRREALEAGMNEHIAKPVRIEVLKEALGKFLQ